MHTGWAIAAGLAVGVGAAWWLSREAPAREAARAQRAQQAAAAAARDARPVLYRWTDDAGTLQVTQSPPPRGRRYEKVDIRPRDGIEVDGRH